jgi:hypothetical protein
MKIMAQENEKKHSIFINGKFNHDLPRRFNYCLGYVEHKRSIPPDYDFLNNEIYTGNKLNLN